MQHGGEPLRVTLTVDLTKYDSRCVVGSEGYTVPYGKLTAFGGFDHFVTVKFDSGAMLDIARSGLKYENELETTSNG